MTRLRIRKTWDFAFLLGLGLGLETKSFTLWHTKFE
jgi:hypothetical protein